MTQTQEGENLDRALVVLRQAIDAAPGDNLSWSEYLDRLAIPIRVSELVLDKAREAVGLWLIYGYDRFRADKADNITAFCREVKSGLVDRGIDNPPSIETLRGWYYAASRPELLAIAQEDGFGMASACLLANDPDGERASALRAAAKQVASETGMGQVAAARHLRAAYQGQEEQEWADGLPSLVYWQDGSMVGSGDRKMWIVAAQWRDGELTQLGFLLDPDGCDYGTRERVAAQHAGNLLHMRKWEE